MNLKEMKNMENIKAREAGLRRMERWIDDTTGYGNGDYFPSIEEAKAYLTIENMKEMWGQDFDGMDITQEDLDTMYRFVENTKYHIRE